MVYLILLMLKLLRLIIIQLILVSKINLGNLLLLSIFFSHFLVVFVGSLGVWSLLHTFCLLVFPFIDFILLLQRHRSWPALMVLRLKLLIILMRLLLKCRAWWILVHRNLLLGTKWLHWLVIWVKYLLILLIRWKLILILKMTMPTSPSIATSSIASPSKMTSSSCSASVIASATTSEAGIWLPTVVMWRWRIPGLVIDGVVSSIATSIVIIVLVSVWTIKVISHIVLVSSEIIVIVMGWSASHRICLLILIHNWLRCVHFLLSLLIIIGH